MFGYITFIKWNLVRKETHLSQKTFTVSRIQPSNNNMERNLPATKTYFAPLRFRYGLVSLYLFQTHNAVLKLIVCN
jgi:hypothetical protein